VRLVDPGVDETVTEGADAHRGTWRYHGSLLCALLAYLYTDLGTDIPCCGALEGFVLNPEMEERLNRVLERLEAYQPERIILFGSYARGEADDYSDLDFVVIKKTDKRFVERLIEVADLLDNDAGDIEVFVYTPEEFERMIEWGNPFMERVLKEGRVVYEKE